jgi:hypothetical protein
MAKKKREVRLEMEYDPQGLVENAGDALGVVLLHMVEKCSNPWLSY